MIILVNRNHFEFLHIIGRGGFGKVWKVKLKKTNEYFALKEMSKTKIIDRRSEISIMSERTLLSKLNNPFIVNMYFAFQDYLNLYLVMDLLSGGDLRYHLGKKKKFTEKETKFFISNIILALDYIHSKNIIHRDIKPENLVLELSGYLRITDFGVAKINEKDNSKETSGTPGYMAPEVMLVQNHSFPSDFFALGVIGYEFMLGYRPYLGRSRKEIKELIIYKQAKLNDGEIPYTWSIEAADFINKLLKRKPNKRLGYNGINELKSHIWMRDINWNALKRKELVAPFIPNPNRENFDKKYCEKFEDVGRATLARYKEYKESELFLDAFKGYTYINLTYIKSKYKKFKKSKSLGKNENKNNLISNIKSTPNQEENNKNLTVKTPTSNMKKNNSMIIEEKKFNSFGSEKNININKNSKSQKILNIDINLYNKYQSQRNSHVNIGNNNNQKVALKRMTDINYIKSAKNPYNYGSNNKHNRITKNKENDKEGNYDNYDLEKLKARALKISEKLKEMKKNQTKCEIDINKKENKKEMNKSSSMKKLNINIGINYNFQKSKNNKKKNRNESNRKNNTNNFKTIDKNISNINNNNEVRKSLIIKNSSEKIMYPLRIINSNKKKTNKNNNCNSVSINGRSGIKKEERKTSEINMKINSDKKKMNDIGEIKNIINENKKIFNHKSLLISNDFNIKEFEKETYNEPRSKVMLWIQKSHPINQSNKWNTIDKNQNITKINKDINDKNNTNKNNQKEEINNFQSPMRHSVNESNKKIKRKLNIEQIVQKSNNKNKRRVLSQNRLLNSLNRDNNYRTTKINKNDKNKEKKIINKKKYTSSGSTKRIFYPKNNSSSQSVHFEKSTLVTKSVNSKSPKNTFLVFNTININLGNEQKTQSKINTPKAQAIRNIGSSLKNAYLKGDFIFGSMPYFHKKEKGKIQISNN